MDLGGLSTIENRLTGFEKGLLEAGISWSRRAGVVKTSMNIEKARTKIARLVREGRKFDGVFSTMDAGALGALLGLEDAGIRVPDDVNVVGFDDVPLGKYSRPPLATIKQDVAALASAGARLLIETLETRAQTSRHKVIPVSLIKRGSIRT